MAIRLGALKHIVPWCRGCTGDFDSLSSGSIPDGTTTKFLKANPVSAVSVIIICYNGVN